MSQASEMIAEVKGLVAELEKEAKSFEKQVEGVGGVGGPDVIHLGKMLIHGRIFQTDLRNRRGNVEDAELAAMEAEETAETQDPAELVDAMKKDELQAAAADAGVDVPASATKTEIATAIVEQQAEPDPAAGLVGQPEPTPTPTPEQPSA